MATAGGIPLMYSTFGLSSFPRNWRAYELKLSTYRLCPSANRVSKAKELLPEPLTPVITTSRLRGIFMLTSFRLCTEARLISMNSVMYSWSQNTNVTLKPAYSSLEIHHFGIVFDSFSYIDHKLKDLPIEILLR